MKKIIAVVSGLSFLAVQVWAQTDEELVRKTFNNYKQSILNAQGKEAIRFIDQKTVRYYDKELELSVSGDSATINNLALMDKLTVFIARHQVPKSELLSMTGSQFFIYAVDQGMIGKNSVIAIQIGEVQVKGEVAYGRMVSNGQDTPLFFQFNKESKQWKVNLTSVLPQANASLAEMLSAQGLSDNDFIFQTLESKTGRKVAKDIWKALK